MLSLLKKLKDENESVCLIIKSGKSCCQIKGDIIKIINNKIIILVNKNCQNIYVSIDCICAVQKEKNFPRKLKGPTGPKGPEGGLLSYADFYALMPPDNTATVASGTDVDFPQDGPTSGTTITRIDDSSFNLAELGTYQILFQVSVSEAGQLVLTLNGNELAYTVVGRATGTSQIVGIVLVETTEINSTLTVRNPAANPTALTITPLAGGAEAVSAHLVIT